MTSPASENPFDRSYNPFGLKVFLLVVFLVLGVESLVWLVSVETTGWLVTEVQRLVSRAGEAASTLSAGSRRALIDQASKISLFTFMGILTLFVTGFLLVLRYWFFKPIGLILEKDRESKSGRPRLIPEDQIPRNEIGLIIESRNEMLRALDQLFSEEAIETLVQAVDAKDQYTRGHSRRVGEFSYRMGQRLSLPEGRCEKLRHSGILHDIGKIGLPDDILTASGELTENQFETIRKHPVRGAEMIQLSQFDEDVLDGIRHHHERYDGTGYPEGLSGPSIPPFGRILATADAVDAMLSDRSYRDALDLEDTIAELRRHSGEQFDPELARIARQLLREPEVQRMYDVDATGS